MGLSAGDRLGPYEILCAVGEGGMGQVWKARDTRLNRIVAIKISRQQFSERFGREARAVAALNHPNICTLYDVGPDYLVMEFIDGPTLTERMVRGAMPLADALPIARQIAGALEAAHEKGIIHRDLKPDNVKVTANGSVKVLDFGLAKAIEAGQDPALASTIEINADASRAGMIVGTPAYMSPEQASGDPVDKRTDIWSYGVILWELVTGRRMFQGANVAHVLAAVQTGAPDIEAAPTSIRQLLYRCLVKDPTKRMRDIGEARLMLDGETPEHPRPVPQSRIPWMVAAAAMLIAAVVSFAPSRMTPSTERRLIRLDIALGPDVALGSTYGAEAILSPNGTRLAIVSKSRLFTRRLDQSEMSELNGTEGAFAPFFAPDSQSVAFFAGGKLKKVPVEGGAVTTLCDAPNPRGGAWAEDRTIVAALSGRAGLSRIPETGGTPEPLTELQTGEVTHRWPQILPGGDAVLFTASASADAFDGASIVVMSMSNRRRKVVQQGGTYGRYMPAPTTSERGGHLLFIHRGTLFAVPFDPDTLDVRGAPKPVLRGISYSHTVGFAQLAFSDSGMLVYGRDTGGGMVTLQWLDSTGKLEPLPLKPGPYMQPHLSPDGKLIALVVGGGAGSDIWAYDWRRDIMSRVTGGDGAYTSPAWSADGRFLVFQAQSGIFWVRSDGSGKPEALTRSESGQWPWSFSPDGNRLAFTEGGSRGFELWTVPVRSDGSKLEAGTPTAFLHSAPNQSFPAFSPDGRWIAYRSLEETAEIYVRRFPDGGSKTRISNDGGGFAVWSPNGRELFYRTPDQQIMVVSYRTQGDLFIPSKPRLWSDKRLADSISYQNFDISSDGKRSLVLMPAEVSGNQRAKDHLTLLLNFSDELRRVAP